MSSYKLAFIIERYFEFGGLEQNMRRMAYLCAKEGNDVSVFTGRWDGPHDPLVNIQIVPFKTWTNHGTINRMEQFVLNLRRQNQYDCIIGFNRVKGLDIYYGGDICLKARLHQQNRYWLRFLPHYCTYLRQEKSVFGQDSKTDLMLITPFEADKIQQIYSTQINRIHMLPPGIDRRRLTKNTITSEQRSKFRKQYGLGDDGFLILSVGSDFKRKGFDRAIKAIGSLPEHLKRRCHYVVAGQDRSGKFSRIAKAAGIAAQVTFTGGRNDISDFYNAADILLHPARFENAGNVLLEAIMAGLPVIVTEICGFSSYISLANAGAVCPEPFDQNHLNLFVRNMLTNDKYRQTCSQNGRKFCQTADIYSRIEKGVQVILNCAEKNRNRNHLKAIKKAEPESSAFLKLEKFCEFS